MLPELKSPARRRIRAACSAIIEPLESRRLLSAASPFTDMSFMDMLDPSVNLPRQLFTEHKSAALMDTDATYSLSGTSSGATFTPMTGPEFQQALNNAQLGDTIVLQAGVTYTGWFTLPVKTSGTGWITIQSSNLEQLPPPGVRVSPADAVNMPRLQSGGGNTSVIRTTINAQGVPSHHYRFVGIEFVGPANNSNLTALISLGTDGSEQNSLDKVAHHFIIDRSYMRPNTPTAHIRRAIALNSAYTDIINSYIEEIHQPGSDSQAIGGWNGSGPYNIINNRLEGASENIMFGGARNRLVDTVPSDIVIRGNHIIKPTHWLGLNYNVKNLFELKHGARILLEGNILENCWTQGQTGYAIVLKIGDIEVSPWNVTEDITLVNNIIRKANGGLSLQGRDWAARGPNNEILDQGGKVRRLNIINNVFDEMNGPFQSGSGTFFTLITDGPKDVTIDHNTIFNGFSLIEVATSNEQWPATNFVYTNNIGAHNQYGIRSSSGIGNPTILKYFNDGTDEEAKARLTRNVLMGGNSNNYTSRPGNFFPANWGAVQFVDQAGKDYRLAETSPYKNAGTTGKDVGANHDDIDHATRGAISGIWGTPVDVLATEFVWQSAPHQAMVQFSTDVGPSLEKSNFIVQNLTAGTTVPEANFSLSYLSGSNTAVLTFDGYPNGVLPDGNYLVTVQRSGISSSDGGAMAENHPFSFFYLAGDANRDGKVNIADLSILANNWMQPLYGPQFGDFNYDGIVNIADLSILAAGWQTDLTAPTGLLLGGEGFDYDTAGGLNETSGGNGFGSNPWTAADGWNSPALATGSMSYSDGTLSLDTSGNKLQPATNSRSTRNFENVIPTAGQTYWVSFRINQTGTGTLPSNHAGFSLYDGPDGTGTYLFLGKPGFSATNYGMDHSGTVVQKSGNVTSADRNAFLVYRLEFTGSEVTISMWINPPLSESALGAPHATLTKAHTTDIRSLQVSIGGNSVNYQLDEFRIGTSFAVVAPYIMPSLANAPEIMAALEARDAELAEPTEPTDEARGKGQGARGNMHLLSPLAARPSPDGLFSSNPIELEETEDDLLSLANGKGRSK